jgi:hypothetical protein
LTVAQSDEQTAYVPSRPPANEASANELGFQTGSGSDRMQLDLPAGTWQVDILNSKGSVVRTLTTTELDNMDLDDLGKGTWTLRAHTPEGLSVRRFVVMQPGQVAWALPTLPKRR